MIEPGRSTRVPTDEVEFPATPAGRLAWAWGPAVLMMAAIFIASGVPNLRELPAGMSDHQWHFIAYAALGALVVRAVAGASWTGVTLPAAAIAWFIASAYGASDEWHQSFVPGRTPAFDDWIADALGAGLAVLVVLVAAAGRRLEDRKV